jgi:hypothetical protein
MPQAVENLMGRVAKAYATADAAAVKSMIDDAVAGPGAKLVHMKETEDRFLRFPKQSFYYSVRY